MLLAAAMWEPAAAVAVAEVDSRDWTRPAHRTCAEAVAALVDEGRLVDLTTITEHLALADKLDEVGGPVALYDLMRYAIPEAWRHHLSRVETEADRRRQVRDHLHALRDLGVEVEELAAGRDAA